MQSATVELSDEELEAAGGGTGSGKAVCPCFGMASVIQRILGM